MIFILHLFKTQTCFIIGLFSKNSSTLFFNKFPCYYGMFGLDPY